MTNDFSCIDCDKYADTNSTLRTFPFHDRRMNFQLDFKMSDPQQNSQHASFFKGSLEEQPLQPVCLYANVIIKKQWLKIASCLSRLKTEHIGGKKKKKQAKHPLKSYQTNTRFDQSTLPPSAEWVLPHQTCLMLVLLPHSWEQPG